jgi:mannitol-1-phosphate 5-dehydrogenase
MGQIFTEAGYEVVFVDVVPRVVQALNERRSYPLRLVGPDRFETLTVGPVRAVDGRDVDAVAAALAECAFACTAVGVPALPHVVPALAAGIERRSGPLDVILCENQLRCSELVSGLLEQRLPRERLASVGLVESVVSRMVPVVPPEEQDDPLLAVAEDYSRLPVDRRAFVGEVPPVPAIVPVENFPAYFDRKLYVHNLGHAAAAYLGYGRGCRYVHEAMAVPEAKETVTGAMGESCEALARKHGLGREELADHRRDLVRRFENAALRDTVLRVGRDPARKLRPEDRLIGGALTCLDWNVEPACIVRAVAAAFRFDPEDDPSAAAVQQVLRQHGVGQALLQFTGQRPDTELGRRILAAFDGEGA